MSDQIKSRLQHNKTVVDEYLMKKTLSHVEVVGSECAVEFFEYLRDIGIADSFASAAYQAERKSTDYQEFFPLLYMLNILTGQKSVRRSQILLKDQALMHVMGWSDEKTERGICQRGTGNQYGQGFVRKAGLVASTTLVDNLARFAYSDLEACFNQYIKSLVSQNHINLGKVFILDSTIVETIKTWGKYSYWIPPLLKPLRTSPEPNRFVAKMMRAGRYGDLRYSSFSRLRPRYP